MSIKFVLKQINNSPSADNSVIGEYFFDDNLITVGSDVSNTIVVADGAAEQAVLVREGELVTLINSSHGTSLNARNLPREAIEPLAVGDDIKIGNFIISVISGEELSATNQTAALVLPAPTSAPVLTAANKSEKISLSEQNTESDAAEIKPVRSFADILNTLRTEEDSFYFIVKNGSEENTTRIQIEQAEMPLGSDAQGGITGASEQIKNLLAIVRKDWSGIVIEKQSGGAILVNDETVQTTRRLRNGDRINFQTPRKIGKKMPSLELHEPSSLVALESILENTPKNGGKSFNGTINSAADNPDASVKTTLPIIERHYFGYFSFFEVVVMAIGTLIAAVVIFLLLEFIIG